MRSIEIALREFPKMNSEPSIGDITLSEKIQELSKQLHLSISIIWPINHPPPGLKALTEARRWIVL